MNRSFSTFVAAIVAVTSTIPTFAPAQAAAPRMAPLAAIEGQSSKIEQVRDRGGRRYVYRQWRPRHYSHRRNYYSYPRYRHHRHYYHDNDVGLAVGLGLFGLAAGAIAGSQYYGGYDWYDACERRYRSFNRRTGMYRGYDGHWHRCVIR